jgi:hypothetical protein
MIGIGVVAPFRPTLERHPVIGDLRALLQLV